MRNQLVVVDHLGHKQTEKQFSHGGNTGSNPVEDAKKFNCLLIKAKTDVPVVSRPWNHPEPERGGSSTRVRTHLLQRQRRRLMILGGDRTGLIVGPESARLPPL